MTCLYKLTICSPPAFFLTTTTATADQLRVTFGLGHLLTLDHLHPSHLHSNNPQASCQPTHHRGLMATTTDPGTLQASPIGKRIANTRQLTATALRLHTLLRQTTAACQLTPTTHHPACPSHLSPSTTSVSATITSATSSSRTYGCR